MHSDQQDIFDLDSKYIVFYFIKQNIQESNLGVAWNGRRNNVPLFERLSNANDSTN